MTTAKVVIADDHPMFIEGIQSSLVTKVQQLHVLTATSYLDLFSVLEQESNDLDLLLMDLHMPGATNEAGIFYIRKLYPEIPIVIFSAHDTLDIKMSCLSNGASEFLSKSLQASELVDKVVEMLKGDYRYPQINTQGFQRGTESNLVETLTPSQFKVLHLISNGYPNKNIASLLNISEKTVKNHISAIFEKLNVQNRTQASNLFLRTTQKTFGAKPEY